MELPPVVLPMLATAGPVPTMPGFGFEFKWDGLRAIVSVAGPHLRIVSRNGAEITDSYPELASLVPLLAGHAATLDAEIVALGPGGAPSFAEIQKRMHVRTPSPHLVAAVPIALYVFDLLHFDVPTTALPYSRRRELLDDLALSAPHVLTPPWFTDVPGQDVLATAKEAGLEGVVSKRLDSAYHPGRSHAWIKTPLWQTTEVVIGGWTPGSGRRAATLGSLLLGMHDDRGDLAYVGNVGTGFTDAALDHLLALLTGLEQPGSPFTGEIPREYARAARWTRPALVGEVEFRNWTPDGRLRHPSWRGLRPDRHPDEIALAYPS
ncbi:bifunctional non-homologous end joining protein LigD [Allocatelliglobosispora scoriae]|uniref:DNA ligase (ATP) n=1 Tax=Allocatelliglobosispora scoriae TaxID=643052 RepID=A0A841BJ78_9ACTN|nr:non-homologous end-joining DNA ligase [Allocatelliglobosispora scoriae]MBB5867675.1 bifunctional non-homologous end joining protein LigD [Allocatelliglobosispora scoriae]